MPRFEITVKRTAVEPDQEIGREWRQTGKKNEKGEDEWGYSPSEKGPKEISRTIFVRECSALDLVGLSRLIDRGEKALANK